MCGISGIINWHHTIANLYSSAEAYASALVHRGPDYSQTIRLNDHVIISSNRLAITDPHNSAANMPFFDPESQCAFVFNGEIYNHRALRGSLRHYELKTRSDAEVLFGLLIERGEDALFLLEGMFACCFVNLRERMALLAVDNVSQKSIFYHVQGDTLRFASEPGPLIRDPRIVKSLDPVALAEAISRRQIGGNRTHIREIQKLGGGSLLSWGFQGTKTRKYYHLPFCHQDFADEQRVVEALQEAVRISCQLTMDLEVAGGALLSGGIDSSTVVSEAARNGLPLTTFSLGFESAEGPSYQRDWSVSESPYARTIAERYRTTHRELLLGVQDYFRYFDAWYALADTPLLFHDAPCLLALFEAASPEARVVYTGSGIDELLDGYGGLGSETSGWEIQACQYPSDEQVMEHYFKIDCRSYGVDLSTLLPESDYYQYPHENMAAILNSYSSLKLADSQRVIALMFHGRMSSYEFAQIDRASMRWSVEARAPLIERRVIDACLSFSPSLRYGRGTEKYLFKTAMRPQLPPEIINRKKGPFPMPTQYFFSDAFEQRVREMFDNMSVLERAGVNTRYVRELWQSANPSDRAIFPRLVGLHQLLRRQLPLMSSPSDTGD